MSLIDLLNTRLDVVKSAGPLAVMFAAQDFAETAAAIIRDHETSLAALERLHGSRVRRTPGTFWKNRATRTLICEGWAISYRHRHGELSALP